MELKWAGEVFGVRRAGEGGVAVRPHRRGEGRVGGGPLPVSVHTPPCRPKPHDSRGGPAFLVAGLGAHRGRTFSFQATSTLLQVLSNRRGLSGGSENPPPPTSAPGFSFKFETHLSSFIIIWQVSFKKKIHLMKYFCLNTSTLDLQKCAHLEYI